MSSSEIFVITGPIPGFHEGDVVDLRAGRLAHLLTMDERWIILRYRHHLRSLLSLPADRPDLAKHEAPRLLRAME